MKPSLRKHITNGLLLNSDSLQVTELEPEGDPCEGVFYSRSCDEIGEDCLSSKDFKQFSPILDKDQAIVCKIILLIKSGKKP